MKHSEDLWDAWLREQAKQAEYQPNQADWEAFEPKLPPQRKKRAMFFWWWTVMGIAVIATGVYLFIPKNAEVSNAPYHYISHNSVKAPSNMAPPASEGKHENFNASNNMVLSGPHAFQKVAAQKVLPAKHQPLKNKPELEMVEMRLNDKTIGNDIYIQPDAVSSDSMLSKPSKDSLDLKTIAPDSIPHQPKPSKPAKHARFFAGLTYGGMFIPNVSVHNLIYQPHHLQGFSLPLGIYLNKHIYMSTSPGIWKGTAQIRQEVQVTRITSRVVYYTGLKMDPGTGHITKVKYQNRVTDTSQEIVKHQGTESIQLISLPISIGYDYSGRRWSFGGSIGAQWLRRSHSQFEGDLVAPVTLYNLNTWLFQTAVHLGMDIKSHMRDIGQYGFSKPMSSGSLIPQQSQLSLGILYFIH